MVSRQGRMGHSDLSPATRALYDDMMFNNPSMQAAYRSQHAQIRDVRVDFMRVGPSLPVDVGV